MAEFTLYYFNIRGRAEVSRIILEISGKEYQEECVSGKWDELKKKMTESGEVAYGQLPLLKHNGNNIVQSNTIVRYLGRVLNLYGDNDDEKWQIDMTIDGVADLKTRYYTAVLSKDREATIKDFIENILPVWIGYFENLKKKNAGDFFVGKRVSIADAAAYDVLYDCDILSNGLVKKNAVLKAFLEVFEKQPKYAEYRKSSRYHVKSTNFS